MNSEQMVRDNFLRHSGAKKGATPMMQDQSLPPPSARDTLADLLAIISDPKSVKARIDALDKSTEANKKTIADAAEAQKKLTDIDEELKARREAHQGELDHEREVQEESFRRRHDELTAAERQVQLRRDEADKLHTEATKLKASLDERERKLRAAVGALA